MRDARIQVAFWVTIAIFTFGAVCGGLLLASGRGTASLLIALLGMGISLGPGLAFYALAPKARKQFARKLVLLSGGLTILGFSLLASANIEIEGVFLLLFEGAIGVAIGHAAATLVVGPLFFGRILCGWGCWRAMVLEFLPICREQRARRGHWRLLPFAGMGLAVGASAVAFFVFGHRAGGVPGSTATAGTEALLVGFAIYYVVSIGLAYALRDPRAFCKYLCPNAVLLRWTSRFSLLRIAADSELCQGCGACSRTCPMDVDVRAFALTGDCVTSGECILCQQCIQACPVGALATSLRFRSWRQTMRLL
jgi:ferredoxin-type protein NapH